MSDALPPNPRSRIDLGLERLVLAAAKWLSASAQKTWRGRARAELDGTVRFEFASEEGNVAYLWTNRRSTQAKVEESDFAIVELTCKGLEHAVGKALVQTLARAVASETFADYAPPGPDAPSFTASACFHDLAVGWLAAGQAGWFEWRVTLAESQRTALHLRFEREGRRIDLELRDRSATRNDRENADSEEDLIERGALILRCTRDERTDVQRNGYAHQVERAVAFALSRRVHPEALQLDEPEEDSREDWIDLLQQGDAPLPSALEASPDIAWRQFMAEDEYEYAVSTACSQATDKIDFVSHSDRNCIAMRPMARGRLAWQIRPPWRLAAGREQRILSTELSDADVIHDGGEARLAGLLERCVESGEPDRLVFFLPTCIPKLLGQDSRAVKTRLLEKRSVAFINPYPQAAFDAHEDAIARQFSELMTYRPPLAPSQDPSLALIGYAPGQDLDELAELLAVVGVRVSANLLPRMDLKQLRGYSAAWKQVLLSYKGWRRLYDGVFRPSGIPVVEIGAPFGIENSAAWCAQLAETFGLSQGWERVWDERRSDWERRRDALRAETAGTALHVVCDLGQVSRLWQPERNFGWSPLPFLHEFGIGCRVLIYRSADLTVTADRLKRRMVEILEDAGIPHERFETALFETPEDLQRLLSAGAPGPVFSETTYDERLVRAGRAGIGLSDFEKGFEGALRSVRRFIRLARYDFPARLRDALQGAK